MLSAFPGSRHAGRAMGMRAWMTPTTVHRGWAVGGGERPLASRRHLAEASAMRRARYALLLASATHCFQGFFIVVSFRDSGDCRLARRAGRGSSCSSRRSVRRRHASHCRSVSAAAIPVAALLITVGPVPAQSRRRRWRRAAAHRGDDDGAEHHSGDEITRAVAVPAAVAQVEGDVRAECQQPVEVTRQPGLGIV